MAGSETVRQSPYTISRHARNTAPGGPTQSTTMVTGQRMDLTEVVYNYLLYTEDFTQATWVKTGLSAANDSEESGFFIRNYGALTVSAAGQTLVQTTADTFASGETVHFGVWLKGENNQIVTLKLMQNSTSAEEEVECEVTEDWQYFEVSKAWTATSTAKVTIETGNVYNLDVNAPQVSKGTVRFNMYLKSTATKGSYIRVKNKARFRMIENPTEFSWRATPMLETPDSSTAYMMEN